MAGRLEGQVDIQVRGSYLENIQAVTRSNRVGAIYLNGSDRDDAPDDSLRIVIDETGTRFKFERKTGGTWNPASLVTAAETIFFSLDTSLETFGQWLSTFNKLEGSNALLPHVNYTDDGTGMAECPVLGRKATVFTQPSENAQVQGKEVSDIALVPGGVVTSRIFFKTGSIGATAPVTMELRRDSPTGEIFWTRNLPLDLMATPNTEFSVDIVGNVATPGVGGASAVSTVFRSDEIISLKVDSVSMNFWGGGDVQPVFQEDMLLDNMVLSNELDFVFDNTGNFTVSDQFRGGPDA